jgi:hypothetical protein
MASQSGNNCRTTFFISGQRFSYQDNVFHIRTTLSYQDYFFSHQDYFFSYQKHNFSIIFFYHGRTFIAHRKNFHCIKKLSSGIIFIQDIIFYIRTKFLYQDLFFDIFLYYVRTFIRIFTMYTKLSSEFFFIQDIIFHIRKRKVCLWCSIP